MKYFVNLELLMKIASKFAVLAAVAVALTGCATTTYVGPDGYVGYVEDGKVKQGTQQSLMVAGKEIKTTYDDEYVYDATGNVIKHKQTAYYTSDFGKPEFVVFETEFKVVGGKVLPYRVYCNGVAYIEVDYEILNANNAKGEVKQSSPYRYFIQNYAPPLSTSTYPIPLSISLKNCPVDFASDGKFIVKNSTFSQYYGFDYDDVLTLGFDNIVLKHFSYSKSKLDEGYQKSITNKMQAAMYANNSNKMGNNSYAFDYNWEVINDKICQTKTEFSQTSYQFSVYFLADMTYDKAGQLLTETWSANTDGADSKKPPVVIFKRELKY